MTWETMLKLIAVLISGAGLAWGILQYYFKRVESFERDKIKAREKIKNLEGTIQQIFLDNMKHQIENLEKQLDDHALKFDEMSFKYDGVSKRVERTALMLGAVSEDVKRLYREVTDNKTAHGQVFRGKWGKQDD